MKAKTGILPSNEETVSLFRTEWRMVEFAKKGRICSGEVILTIMRRFLPVLIEVYLPIFNEVNCLTYTKFLPFLKDAFE